MAISLKVVTPARTVVDAEVSELTGPGFAGEFGVLPEHVTFLGLLDVGVLTFVEGGKTKKLIVRGGYAEVIDDVVTILADDAQFGSEVDAGAVREELGRIERELERSDVTPDEVDSLLNAQRLAETQLEVSGA